MSVEETEKFLILEGSVSVDELEDVLKKERLRMSVIGHHCWASGNLSWLCDMCWYCGTKW